MGDPSSPLPLAGGAGGKRSLSSSDAHADSARPPPSPLPLAGGGEEGAPLRFRTDEPHDEPAVTLDSFIAGQTNATAVRLEAADDARALLPHIGQIALVEISFPSFRDGRGYSAASILREAGYAGELRAQGDVLVDQIAFMRRCGFDSFAPEAPVDPTVLQRSLDRYAEHYQPAADHAVPVWKRRHG